MTAEQICERLDEIEERGGYADVRDDIAALRLDIEIDIRRAEDAKRATETPTLEVRVA